MKAFSFVSLLVIAAAVAGCATQAETSPAAGAPTSAAQDQPRKVTPTGSRIARKETGTDRMVQGVDNESFRRDSNIRSLGDTIGARGN